MAFAAESQNTYFTQYLKVASNDNVEMFGRIIGQLCMKVRLMCKKCDSKLDVDDSGFIHGGVPQELQDFVKKHRHDPIIVGNQWDKSNYYKKNWAKATPTLAEIQEKEEIKKAMLKKLMDMEQKAIQLEKEAEAEKKEKEAKLAEVPKGRRFRE